MLALFVLSTTAVSSEAAERITTIDSSTFGNNIKITKVHVGSDVIDITSGAFRKLGNLQEITVSKDNPFYASYSGCLYDKDMTELLRFPPKLKSAVIPSTVVSIGENALHGVPEKLKAQIREAVEEHASDDLSEEDIPGAHFIHTDRGVKWKEEDGRVIMPKSSVMLLAAQVVDDSTTVMMTQPEQLESVFNYLAQNISYIRSYDTPSGDWVREYAATTLGTKTGNCYGYAAAFAYVARGLGYETRVCTGTVQSALGGTTPHAWTEVKMGKKWYIFDTEMQAAKGGGYYKQTYESYPAKPIVKESSWNINY